MSARIKKLVAERAGSLVALSAVLASASSVRNRFALDDVEIIVKNPHVHTLMSPWRFFGTTYWPAEHGGALYRPLTLLVFAAQWLIGNGSPLVYHLVSIAVYAALSVSVYRLARLLMPASGAFLAALIFAVQPVHVEAVANVVGQAEIWAALIIVVVMNRYIYVRRLRPLKAAEIVVLTIGYLGACAFKEHAIVLPVILIAAEWLLIDDEKSLRERAREMVPLVTALAIAGVGFVAARYSVLHGVGGGSPAAIFQGQSFATRFFTMLSVVMEWIRLFFWPMSLSADYSFPRVRTHTGLEMEMIPGLAVIVGATWIGWRLRKRSPAAVFGLVWLGIAMLIPSNILVATGFVLAERTLMLASVGFVLCVGVAVSEAGRVMNQMEGFMPRLAAAAFAALLVCFASRSMTRGPVWHDNGTLFAQTIQDVPSNHRGYWMLAIDLADKGRVPEALNAIDLAVALSDGKDPLLLAYAADLFATAGRCSRATTLYRRALALAPDNVQLRANTAFCLVAIGKSSEARAVALAAGRDSRDSRLQAIVAKADSLAATRR